VAFAAGGATRVWGGHTQLASFATPDVELSNVRRFAIQLSKENAISERDLPPGYHRGDRINDTIRFAGWLGSLRSGWVETTETGGCPWQYGHRDSVTAHRTTVDPGNRLSDSKVIQKK